VRFYLYTFFFTFFFFVVLNKIDYYYYYIIYISYLKGKRKKESRRGKVGNGRGTGEREEHLLKKDFHMKKKNWKKEN
jgi:hypothetical protein